MSNVKSSGQSKKCNFALCKTRKRIVFDEEEEGYRLLLLGIWLKSSCVTKCTIGGGILTKVEIRNRGYVKLKNWISGPKKWWMRWGKLVISWDRYQGHDQASGKSYTWNVLGLSLTPQHLPIIFSNLLVLQNIFSLNTSFISFK